MLINLSNWLSALRIFWIVGHPIQFVVAIALRRNPAHVTLRTPTGLIRLRLRNFESLKTLFSIFCRRDYKTSSVAPYFFLDVGANIGIASAYFLSRNPANRVQCFEPDPANLDFLRDNLEQFGGRATLRACAVGPQSGEVTLYCSEDGKYSSLVQSARAANPVRVPCLQFSDVLKGAGTDGRPVVVKLDVEGLEVDLVRSVMFEEYPAVGRLVCESTSCARWITRPHRLVIRSGYVEDVAFLG